MAAKPGKVDLWAGVYSRAKPKGTMPTSSKARGPVKANRTAKPARKAGGRI